MKLRLEVTIWQSLLLTLEKEIKDVRSKIGVSRAGFADILGVSTRTIEKWEINGAEPNGSARRLIQLLDNNPEDILEEIKQVSSL